MLPKLEFELMSIKFRLLDKDNTNFKFVEQSHPTHTNGWDELRGDDTEEWIETKFERFPLKDIMQLDKLEEIQNCNTTIYENKAFTRTIDLFWETYIKHLHHRKTLKYVVYLY